VNLHSYPTIYAMGHRAIADLLSGPVNVEEKIDGSQFSFGVKDGELIARSKGAKLHIDAPEKMFDNAIATIRQLRPHLRDGWTYRCEYLKKPKHNTLAYARVPAMHLIVFDINTAGEEMYLDHAAKFTEAARLGLECVPLIYSGKLDGIEQFRSFLDRESILGGQKIEGVVVKPRDYALFGVDKKCLLGKFVSEAFKEIHGGEWRKENPTSKDILEGLGSKYRTPARWNKGISHLRDAGTLEGSPRDIGKLIKEVQSDVEKECTDEIKQALYDWAWPHIRRTITYGMPEWYKEELLKAALNEQEMGKKQAAVEKSQSDASAMLTEAKA
jgi:hypothetical protein